LIAFEMAQQLSAQGQEVALLALFDTAVPQHAEQLTREEEIGILRSLAHEHGLNVEGLGPHTSEEQLSAILEQLQQENTLLQEVGLTKIRQIMHVSQANYRALRTYALRCYSGRVTFFQAAESITADSPDQYGEWSGLAAGGVERHIIPGSHLSIVQEPHVRVLAERLNSCMAAVRDAEGGSYDT
jgi:thioesterase domain-containing protein